MAHATNHVSKVLNAETADLMLFKVNVFPVRMATNYKMINVFSTQMINAYKKMDSSQTIVFHVHKSTI